MAQINRMGISLLLQIPLEQLARRVYPARNQAQVRPLFAGKNQAEIFDTLQAMWQKRAPFYQQAHILLSPRETKADKAWQQIEKFVQQKTSSTGFRN
jgi:shikimate kinase